MMKKIALSILLGIGFVASALGVGRAQAAEQTKPLSLSECFALALKQSETIAINQEHIREAEAHFLQAFGTAIPNVSFSASQTWERSEASPSLNRSHENKFVFTQTLFSGFKEFAAMAGSGSEKKQRINEKARAEHLLFVDVADAFYLLIEIRQDLTALETIQKALVDRIEELKQRQAVGRSRESEVVSAQVQLYNVEALIESDKSQEAVARDLLEFLVGMPVGEIVDTTQEDFTLRTETEYLARLDMRPDVIAAQNAWSVARQQIAVAQADLFPKVTLEGDYFTHRSSAPSDSAWSTVAKVNVPLFAGTTTFGNIKAANALASESQLLYTQTRRLALQDIRDSYFKAQSSLVQKSALLKALKAAELNYSLQLDDYRKSLVNNLEVLSALQTLEDTRRSYIHTLYESKRFYGQLFAAVGEIPAENK